MLDRAHRALDQLGAETTVRVDVPGRGSGEHADDSGATRTSVDPIIPVLQSGSLFGERTGALVVDAQNLLKSECEVITDLLQRADTDALAVIFVSAGAVPAPLGKLLKDIGELVSVKKLRERDATDWLIQAAKDRKLKLNGEAVAMLLQRFGSDVAALGQALDQLAATGEEVTAEDIQARFRNRPDEPMWHYSDAVAAGDVGAALRRLEDFLLHGHPLQLLAFLENDLRRRSLASSAPNIATFADWIGSSADAYPVKKAWRQRSDANESDLRLALDALARADLLLKSAPEPTHRVSLERLTVALCRWYGGSRRVSA
jgi:DNA polymerase III delta subunit